MESRLSMWPESVSADGYMGYFSWGDKIEEEGHLEKKKLHNSTALINQNWTGAEEGDRLKAIKHFHLQTYCAILCRKD